MKEALVIEINKLLLNFDSSITILNKAILLAEITGNEDYRLLFTHHLNGLSKEESDKILGTRVLSMFSFDRTKISDKGYYLLASISSLERTLQSNKKDIESYLSRAEEHTKNHFIPPNVNNSFSISPYNVQQGVFSSIIAKLRLSESDTEEIISKIRNRVMLFVREIEKNLYNEKSIKINQDRILKKLYESFQQRVDENFNSLQINIGIESNELEKVLEYLKDKALVGKFSQIYAITDKGIKEVELMNKTIQETPEQKRLRVLKTIYDLAEGNPSEIVLFSSIDQEVALDYSKVTGILQYLEQRNLIKIGGEWVQITSNGIDQIETLRNNPEKSTPFFPANIYNNTFNASVTGVQQGNNNNQNNSVKINQDFTNAIEKLLNLIDSSSLNPVQKINTKADVQSIKDLAVLEKTPEVLNVANSKIEAVKEIISMTADMTSLGMVLIPIIQSVFGK